ncbi:putative membrane transporter protein [Neofusicoccum parvum]|uniref:Membrane transporter protein n=1 Tax=Neofusicoccum parvum TaxID=310453 RepID=A0ACB5SLR9_9PEZI|nr:putative membrane transporter protein [Neofusicoccum parvum]
MVSIFSPDSKSKFRLNRPFNQNIIMGCILFCLPGIYLALTALGAGGGKPSSQRVASLTNSILYGPYTLFGWMAGSILNFLKPKKTILIGSIGYPLYAGSLWYYDRTGHQWFPLLAGFILGFCAACLWTSSGFIQFAYAEESEKAMFITWQWVLTSAGSTVGALIAFGVNKDKTEVEGVSTAVWVIFLVIMGLAMVIAAICIVDPKDVRRDDGTHIAVFKQPTFKAEMVGILRILTDKKIIMLLPAMFVAEMCLALVSSVNGHYFNLRTRSLNNLLFQFIMIPTPLAIAWVMDNPRIPTRRLKGIIGASIMGLITLGATAGLLGWITTNGIDANDPSPGIDWTESGFASGFILYILFGIVYATFQICVQWTLSSLTNDPVLCARYAGAFKGTVSLGMCISFVLDSEGVSYRTQTTVQLVLYVIGLTSLLGVTWFFVKDTNYFLEDNVIVPKHVEEEAVVAGIVPHEAVEHERAKEAEAATQSVHSLSKDAKV